MEKVIKGLKIDPLIFTFPFVPGCNIGLCSGECCWYGVYTDLKERDFILENKEIIKQYMDETQTKDETKWFEEVEEDADFESGYCAGTQIYNHKCVFLDKNGYCSLQKAAMDRGEYKWKYKPIYCVIFPLTIYNGTLTVDDEHIARLHYCSKPRHQTSTVFDATKDELIYLLGEDGYNELLEYRNQIIGGNKVEVTK
jgi:Fe-S-cluster containining protein